MVCFNVTDSVYAIRHVKVHLPDAADGQRRVFVIGRPLYAASAALSACGRRLTKLITQQLGMFNSCLLSHTVYIRMPRTTVTMSLGADWLYLEVFYSHLIKCGSESRTKSYPPHILTAIDC